MRRRIGAYGVCRDGQGRVLLVRASDRSVRPGCWLLPGGGVEHGEDPAVAVRREVVEETGLTVAVTGVRDVVAEVIHRPPFLEHTDGVVYDLAVTGGRLRPEPAGTSDLAAWLTLAQAAELPLSRFAAHTLELPLSDPPAGLLPPPKPPPARPSRWRSRGQRFAVYGLVTDPADRVLLTLIADKYPGAGRWHLPGGGSDFGEQPRAALLREITEESGQVGEIGELLKISERRNRLEVGPAGVAVDWHAVRVVFRVRVADPTAPWVVDTGGSTAEAGWFSRAQAAALPLTDIASSLLTGVLEG